MENVNMGGGMVKADLAKRFIAALIDGVIAAVVSFIPLVGSIAGAAYMLLRDGLELEFMDGRSVGKKVMKLRPITNDGSKMTIEKSIRRNWMFALGAFNGILLFIPILGWLLIIVLSIAGLLIGLFEVFKVLTDAEGRRIGDNMAGTKVVETAD
jgi:uncharacterized RDD family membrane protein YckC